MRHKSQEATATIPIALAGFDAVEIGLVTSMSRPHDADVTVATVHVCFGTHSNKGDSLYEKRLAIDVTAAIWC